MSRGRGSLYPSARSWWTRAEGSPDPSSSGAASTYLSSRPLGAPVMVTFDKGARVARLDPGAVLDARQVGILLAQVDGEKRRVRLIEWDRGHDPGATKRIDELIAAKGPDAKTTLMIALSMSVLRTFEIIDHDQGTVARLSGDRGRGYTVEAITPHAE